ncbi:ArsR/SmtB family transcription factor [Lacticigenium naphthae]|uniref:ArsR/SmtB family transcription factor n=1 Tax=Lacticigenium naphthae TaxID=515351 RepID=UPI00040E7CBF|nr:metalloregulator ArsR/SmtB family transcription factor [Lacticigenium naphthae]
MDAEKFSKIAKALSDPKRTQIVELVSCESLCACDLLGYFAMTQPSLSHHLKILKDADLLNVSKEGTWHHYSLNKSTLEDFQERTKEIVSGIIDCSCYEIVNGSSNCATKKQVEQMEVDL